MFSLHSLSPPQTQENLSTLCLFRFNKYAHLHDVQVFWCTLFLSVTVAVCQPLKVERKWDKQRQEVRARPLLFIQFFIRAKFCDNQPFLVLCVLLFKFSNRNFKMSQQQTVRITTTETSHSSALIINTGYLSTPPGILKLLQFVNTIFPHSIFEFDHFS